ncbi:MAG: branched-chain alpha-keto acid dehydrogenase subunit E2 [Comamonadaceae bacterium CG1_02_60_18]|nr:MAG: branched-chain alpha-keto acid dehydrogenase subunit E2 [Comamonadaceae bacterium CG1_02_60_18]PIQ56799.1 MAG: branched-chain alpha-keto acid dehydrogenase subunit E2 [Comamonadaceae bacterium CG12_big_fil_rev_8_21_14_0_65_59_15]
MSIQNIKMPDIGEGIAEVELVAWRVAVGDLVAEDQIVADVMTDKATVEIPSHLAGTVTALNATVGQVVPVGTPIIHIKTTLAHTEQAPEAIISEASDKPVVSVVAPPSPSAATVAAMPAVPMPIKTLPAVMSDIVGALGNTAPINHASASPAVRQRARSLGIDLGQVTASGSAGQVTHSDLDRFLEHSTKNSASGLFDKGFLPDESTETIPVIGLRRKIAQKMQDAKRRIPHFTYVEEVDVTELEDLRAQLNLAHGATRGKLTLLPLLIRALVLALRDHPEINARYDDDAAVVTRYAAVHLGLATQTDGGLMVPVIRHAQTLDLWACAAEIKRLADAARAGKAAREELSGSTITVTSLGPLAGIAHTPVINHPEVAIVGPNRIVERPVVHSGRIEVRKMMNISSSFDHRVVDGMNAAQFIQRLRTLLECPATLFV